MGKFDHNLTLLSALESWLLYEESSLKMAAFVSGSWICPTCPGLRMNRHPYGPQQIANKSGSEIHQNNQSVQGGTP